MTIDERVERLERSNRRLTCVLVLAGAAAAFAATLGIGPAEGIPDILTARCVHLVDENGDVRIAIAAQRKTTSLTFIDQNGQGRLLGRRKVATHL